MKTHAAQVKPKWPSRRECRRKHLFTPDNIYYRKNGYPQCRQCMLAADKRYHRNQNQLQKQTV